MNPTPGAPPSPAHDPTGHTWHHSDSHLIQVVRDGGATGFMPAFGDELSDDEIVAVLDYIKTFWTPDQLQQQASISQ